MPLLRESYEAPMRVRRRAADGLEVLCGVPATGPDELASWTYGPAYPETSLNRRPTGLPEAGQKWRSEIRFRAVLTPVK